MQTGKHKLYNSIVPQSTPEKSQKPRRNTGIEARREVMAYRYYYHAIMCRLRYDDCLLNLSQEFFLQPITIIRELEIRVELIKRLEKQRPGPADLRKKFPWLQWAPKS